MHVQKVTIMPIYIHDVIITYHYTHVITIHYYIHDITIPAFNKFMY